jgi:hypothetical protein
MKLKIYTQLIGFVCFLFIFSVSLPTLRPPVAAQPAVQGEATLPCISVVGDSIAAGNLVAEIPNTGYALLQTTRLSTELDRRIGQTGRAPAIVHDRSTTATYLSDNGLDPYSQTNAYRALLDDACDTVVMTPWNNDLRIQRPNGAEAYVQDLVNFVTTLQERRPDVHVIMFSHYWIAVQPWVDGYGVLLTHRNFRHHHAAFMHACEAGNALAATGAVSCVDAQALLQDPDAGLAVLVGMGAGYINSLLAAGAVTGGADLLQFYFGQNPGGFVVGDGIHLSLTGKQHFVDAALALRDTGPTPLPPAPSLAGLRAGEEAVAPLD